MTEVTLHGLRFEVAAISEKGPRPENQDAFSTEMFPEAGVIALADGMGGEKSGRTAADTALEALRKNAPIRSIDQARRAVREADRLVTRTADADPEKFGGMGSALGLLALTDSGDGPGWIAAHVGDVRILSRSPDGVLRLETRDHTPAFARWEAGEITLDEIPDSAGANRLQRAIGRGGEADVGWLPAAPGWSWLVISDGVYKAMRLDELSAALSLPTTREACEAIRRKVEERGPDDNFTAVVIRAVGGPPAAVPPTASRSDMRGDPPAGRSRTSAGSALALALAVLGLVVAAAALWTARETSTNAVSAETVEQLRLEMDSVRLMMDRLADPFGPSAPPPTDSAIPTPPSATSP